MQVYHGFSVLDKLEDIEVWYAGSFNSLEF